MSGLTTHDSLVLIFVLDLYLDRRWSLWLASPLRLGRRLNSSGVNVVLIVIAASFAFLASLGRGRLGLGRLGGFGDAVAVDLLAADLAPALLGDAAVLVAEDFGDFVPVGL